MQLKSIRCFKRRDFALQVLAVLGAGQTAATYAAQGRKSDISMENAKKQVRQHLKAFRKTKELTELRNSANLIEGIGVHTATFEERQTARAEKLGLWLTLLDTIDAAKDPKFDPADVPAVRITVPPGTPMKPGFPMVTPEGIANPEDRRKYDEAVQANAEKAQRYRFQKELRQLDAELTNRADESIGSILLKSPQSVSQMNEAIAARIHQQDRAAHLRSLVSP